MFDTASTAGAKSLGPSIVCKADETSPVLLGKHSDTSI